ncbi:sprT-like domain containing protein [Rhodotorula toruloides]|uniref:SprT-like domain containing protein n=1 Tax=Rhodotorula toruloides TaxID=5286 RepID=A0A511KGK0_RHOTO|nr:sprT-like domain containing protein [Rhodotorula toruloides]
MLGLRDAQARGSNLRVEIDLKGESSEEDTASPDEKGTKGHDDDAFLPSPPLRRISTSTPSSRPAPPSIPHTPSVRPKAPRLPSQLLPPRTPSSISSVPRLLPKDRQTLPLLLIRELDRSVFRKRWDGLRCLDKKGEEGRGKGLPEGVEVVWSKRLLKTAGRATWKRSRSTTTPGSPEKTTTHQALVELSVKVTDTDAKLKHTLAHELCHLAAWAIDGEMKPPHGPAFKTWAKRVMLVRPDIEVTTTHAYEIVYKYRWQCTRATCGKIFGRHSNSINPSTHGCPCGSRIVPIDKDGNIKSGHGAVASVGGTAGAETPRTERKKSKWVEFLQAQSPLIRRENPSLPQSEVFKLAAERWKAVKADAATISVPATPSKKSGRSAGVVLDPDSDEEGEGDLGKSLGRLEL